MSVCFVRRSSVILVAAAAFYASGSLAADPFPESQPSTRAEALELIGRSADPAARIREIQREPDQPLDIQASERRAVGLLAARPSLLGTRSWRSPGGALVRFTTSQASRDRIDGRDLNQDGVPDRVEAAGRGLDQARQLLIGQLQLPEPVLMEAVYVNLEGAAEGYVSGGESPGQWTVVLDGSVREAESVELELDRIRRAAARQFAMALAYSLGDDYPIAWATALADWTSLTLDGGLGVELAQEISGRLASLPEGLIPAAAAARGQVAWLAYLEEAHGPVALRLTLEALGEGGEQPAALDRALRQATGKGLRAAFRDFHLWALLVGERADRFHFSFASQLTAPGFASANEGLPALSVQADPPIRPWGATQVSFDPQAFDGGLRLMFEGAFGAAWETAWEADVVVSDRDGRLHRIPLRLLDGRGEISIPLQGVDEAWLLVRHIGSLDTLPEIDGAMAQGRSYSYTADREPGYPFELAAIDAVEQETGIVVSWETRTEIDVVGYNVLRLREFGGTERVVNPVWIPALGDAALATSDVFVDQSAQPAVSYVYRIEAITRQGFKARSEAVPARPDLRSDPAARP